VAGFLWDPGPVRADRLVAILLLLQQRGQVTAGEVAEELEVSERTARRDLDALGMAGLPVYAVQGRGGGWRLAGDGRTDLSGLSAEEARALFLVAGPHAATTKEVRAALRKLVRALPEPLRERALAASDAVLVEPTPWGGGDDRADRPPLLDAVQEAVVDRLRLRIAYVDREGTSTEREVDPLGVVAKGRHWYLLAGTDAGRRTLRIDRIAEAVPTGVLATRPADFDLAAEWAAVRERVDDLRTPVRATATVQRDLLGYLQAVVGTRVAVGAEQGPGQVHVELRGHSARSLAAELAGFGAGLVVHEPVPLQAELAQIGAELVATYEAPAPGSGSGPNDDAC
jgi:predicted DNA-binding transcriptional regulator YafY